MRDVRHQGHGGGPGASEAGGGGRWRDHGVTGHSGDPGAGGEQAVRGRVRGDPPQGRGRGRGGGGREPRGERGVTVTRASVVAGAGDPVQAPHRVQSGHLSASDPLLIYSKMKPCKDSKKTFSPDHVTKSEKHEDTEKCSEHQDCQGKWRHLKIHSLNSYVYQTILTYLRNSTYRRLAGLGVTSASPTSMSTSVMVSSVTQASSPGSGLLVLTLITL